MLLVDTDPGVDDLLAMLLLYKYRKSFDISTVFGNAKLTDTTANARYIADKYLNRSARIYRGVERTELENIRFSASSGVNGLNGVDTSGYVKNTSQTIKDILLEDYSEVLCLGPLTNIPTLLSGINGAKNNLRFVIMGGAIDTRGNTTENAEFNVACDPESFDQSLQILTEKNFETVIVPVNVCREVVFNRQDIDDIFRAIGSSELREIVEPFLSYYLYDTNWGGFEGAVLYDIVAASVMLWQDMFTYTPGLITTTTSRGQNFGETTFQSSNESNVSVASCSSPLLLKGKILEVLTK